VKRITNISGSNFRFNKFNVDISPTMLIHGKNGSGKSTIIDAIIISQLGYLPRYGKQASKTMFGARDKSMAIGMTLSDGFKVERVFSGTRARASTETTTFPGGATKDEARATVLTNLGNCTISFDLEEFLSLSDAKARQYIFSILPVDHEKFNREDIISNREMDYENVWSQGMAVQDGIIHVLSWLKSQLSDERKIKKNAESAQKELAKRTAELSETPGQIKSKKSDLDRLIADLPAIQTRIESAMSPDKRTELSNKITELGLQIAEKTEIRAGVTANFKEITLKLNNLPNGFTLDVEEKRVLFEELRISLAKKKAINVFDGSLVAGHVCETCRQTITEEHINVLKKSKFKIISGISSTEKQIDDLDEEIQNLINNHDQQMKELSENRIDLKSALNSGNTEIRNLENTQQKLIDQLSAMGNPDTEAVSVEDLEKQMTVAQEQIKILREEIGELTRQKETMGNLEDANVKAEASRERIDLLKEEIKAFSEVLGKILEDSTGPFMNNVNLILHHVNEGYSFYLDLINETMTKDLFEMGWDRDGIKIPFASLSNGEKALFGLAFQCAVIEAENPPIKVLLADNIERLYGEDRTNFLRAGCKLAENGLLGNFIAAGAVFLGPKQSPGADFHQKSRRGNEETHCDRTRRPNCQHTMDQHVPCCRSENASRIWP